jgi:hypothetical protein
MGRRLQAAIFLSIPLVVWACGDTPPEREGLPDGFPDDLPVYQGAQVVETISQGDTLIVRFQTDAPRQDVTDFYRDAMDREPWRVWGFSDQVADDASSLDFRKPDKTVLGSIDVLKSSQSTKTNFTISISFRTVRDPTEQPAATTEAGGG